MGRLPVFGAVVISCAKAVAPLSPTLFCGRNSARHESLLSKYEAVWPRQRKRRGRVEEEEEEGVRGIRGRGWGSEHAARQGRARMDQTTWPRAGVEWGP